MVFAGMLATIPAPGAREAADWDVQSIELRGEVIVESSPLGPRPLERLLKVEKTEACALFAVEKREL